MKKDLTEINTENDKLINFEILSKKQRIKDT